MKNIWKMAGSLLVIIGWMPVMAQDCEPYYIDNQGAMIEMASYDRKDKPTGSSISTVKEVKNTGDKVEWLVNVVTKDEKGKEVSSGDLGMSCQNGIFTMDMRNFLNEEVMQGFEDMQVTMDATDLAYPQNLSPGQTLPEGNITVAVSNQGVPMMTLVVKIYDRKVEAIEEMTTPAGTFSCAKISQTIETKTMFKTTVKSTDWLAKKVGTVRSETYDKDGKLMSYTVLTSVK